MTSLNTRTGWDGNKQTGSNLTREIIQGSKGELRRVRRGEAPSSAHPSPSSPSSVGNVTRVISPGTLSSPRPTNASRELVTKTEVTSENPYDPDVMRHKKEIFFRENYDPMTGVRIASTLGGFFLLVLLTLLYKSKCKGKHSREPSLHSSYPSIHPGHLLMRGQNIQVNGGRDFSGVSEHRSVGGPDESPPHPVPLTLLDSTCYGYMNQVHPANSHQPVFSNYYGPGGDEAHIKSPAVLLITAANSESSDEELSIVSPAEHTETLFGRAGPEYPLPDRGLKGERGRNSRGIPVLCSSGSQCYLQPRSRSPPTRKGNIDIHVILPTPSISPSGSENFTMREIGESTEGERTLALFPRGAEDKRHLLKSRSLSSDNESNVSDVSGTGCACGRELSVGSEGEPVHPFGCVNSSLFSLDNLKYVDDTSSENIPTRGSDPDEPDQDTRSIGSDSVFACFEHNFDHIAPTYARRVSSVSGTSSGVLAAVSPQAPHRQYSILPTSPSVPCGGRIPTEVAKAGAPLSPRSFGEVEPESELKVTLTQAQVHHRDSFCSDLESVNDYMETGARRRSSSTQTTLSDLRQALGCSPTGWSEGGGASPGTASLTNYPFQHEANTRRLSVPRRRRSLSPHMNPISLPSSSGGRPHQPGHRQSFSATSSNSTTPFLSVRFHPAPPPTLLLGPSHPNPNEPLTPTPTTPTNPPVTSIPMHSPSANASTQCSTGTNSPLRMMRKRSFEAVRKTLSLQCEDKADAASLFVTSSNETTPTN